jgi:hypothetical protein
MSAGGIHGDCKHYCFGNSSAIIDFSSVDTEAVPRISKYWSAEFIPPEAVSSGGDRRFKPFCSATVLRNEFRAPSCRAGNTSARVLPFATLRASAIFENLHFYLF